MTAVRDADGIVAGPRSAPELPGIASMLRIASAALLLVIFTRRNNLLSSDMQLLTVAALVVGAVLLSISALRVSQGPRSNGRAVVAIGLPILAIGLSTMASDVPRLSLEAALPYLFGLGAAGFVAFGGMTVREVGVAIGLFTILLGFLVFAEFVSLVQRWFATMSAIDPGLSLTDRLPVTLPRASIEGSHPNLAAMRLEVGVALFAAIGLWSRGKYRVLALAASGALGVTVLMTGSRSAVLATGFGLILLVSARVRLSGVPTDRRLAVAAGVLSVGTSLALAVAFLAGFRPTFIFRATLGDRLPVYDAAIGMFADSMWLGNGVGAFPRLVDEYLAVYPGTTLRLVWNHAHNSYLQGLLEFGLLGFAAFTVAAAVLFRSVWRRRRSLNAVETGLAVGLVVLALHALTDHVANGPGLTLLVGLMVGALLSSEIGPSVHRRHWLEHGLAGGLLLFIPIMVATTIGSTMAYERGREHVLAGSWDAARVEFASAAAFDSLPVYERMSRLSAMQTGGVATSEVPDRFHVPLNGPQLLNEISVLAKRDVDEAAVLLGQYVDQYQHDEVALVSIGLMFEEFGRPRDAAEAWRRALKVDPGIESAPLWSARSDRDAVVTQLVAEVIDQMACDSHSDLVGSARVDGDRLESLTHCDPGRARWVALAELGRLGEATGELADRLASVPDDQVARRFAGIAEIAAGNLTEARRHLAIAARLEDLPAAVMLLESYGDERVPDAVLDAAGQALGRRGPALRGAVPVYVLASVRMALVDRRPGVPSPLLPGEWQALTPEPDLRLEELLVRQR